MKRRAIVIVFFLLIVATLAIAEEEVTDQFCFTSEWCNDTFLYYEERPEGTTAYCSEEEVCVLVYPDEDFTDDGVTTISDINVSEDIATFEEILSIEQEESLEELRARIAQLEAEATEIAGLELTSTEMQQKLTALENRVNTVQAQLTQLEASLQTLEADQSDVSNQVSTGLASLQQEVSLTQNDVTDVEEQLEEEQSFNTIVKTLIFLLFALITAIIVVYYLGHRQQKEPEVQPEIAKYITSHITKGNKYADIKKHLLKAGWTEEQIDWAYKGTMKKNYQQYQAKKNGKTTKTKAVTPGKPGYDKHKVIFISIFSILVIIGIFFVLKGVTTGQAVFFNSQGQFEVTAERALMQRIDDNQFYDLVTSETNLCVQIVDGDKTISFSIQKGPDDHNIERLEQDCDESVNHDFAVKFQNYAAFDLLVNSMSCSNLRAVHEQQHAVILPSFYVEDGFDSNSNLNYEPFCAVLEECAGEIEIENLGIGC